jgi:serine/threonine protein kinase
MQGTILNNRYLVAEEIGSGGMGNVYRATDLRTGGTVAVKIPHAFLARNEEYLERLRREAQIAASLYSHRVVRVMDLDTYEGLPFLVMEYVPGETLNEVLRERGRFTLAETLLIGLEVARALEAAHAKGIVHRDLKPQNIKVSDREVKVLDFGIAKAEGFSGLTANALFMGTPEYCAPERAEGQGDIRSDIYSLGVILFECYEGYLPFQALTPIAVMRKHQSEPPPPLSGDAPPRARQIVARCLAKKPEDRYQTPEELIQDLLPAIREVPGAHDRLTPLATPVAPSPVSRGTEVGPGSVMPTLVAGAPGVRSPESGGPAAPSLPDSAEETNGYAARADAASSHTAGPAAAAGSIRDGLSPSAATTRPSPPRSQLLSPPTRRAGAAVLDREQRAPAAAGPPAATPTRPGRRPWLWLAGGGAVAALAAGGILAALVQGVWSGGRGTGPSPTAQVRLPSSVGSTASGMADPAPSTAPRTSDSSAQAAPPPAATPEPAGLVSLISLEALTGEERELARAINNANVILIDRVLRRVDDAPLPSLYSGDALRDYQKHVADLRADGRYAVAQIIHTELANPIRFINPTTAQVDTRERWSYDEYDAATRERIVGSGHETLYEERYTLVKNAGRWLVDKLEYLATPEQTLR